MAFTVPQEIAHLTKCDLTTAEKVRAHLEAEWFDFSQCTTSQLKKASKAALVEMGVK